MIRWFFAVQFVGAVSSSISTGKLTVLLANMSSTKPSRTSSKLPRDRPWYSKISKFSIHEHYFLTEWFLFSERTRRCKISCTNWCPDCITKRCAGEENFTKNILNMVRLFLAIRLRRTCISIASRIKIIRSLVAKPYQSPPRFFKYTRVTSHVLYLRILYFSEIISICKCCIQRI